jgi:hypothetical protein
MSKEVSAAQKLIGGFPPKLVDLTDGVLFGDVWDRFGALQAATAVPPPWPR